MSALIIKRVASRILLVRLRERSSRAAHTRVTLRERGRERGRFRKTCRKWKRGRVTHPSLFAAEKRSGGLTSSERWTFRWEFLPDKSHPPFFVLFAARCRLIFARLLKKFMEKKEENRNLPEINAGLVLQIMIQFWTIDTNVVGSFDDG